MKNLAVAILVFMGLPTWSSETIKGIEKDYKSFREELSVQLKTLDQEIAELKNKAQAKGKKIKHETLADLESARKDLQTKVSHLENKSGKQWKTMKKSIAESAESLHEKLQKALKD